MVKILILNLYKVLSYFIIMLTDYIYINDNCLDDFTLKQIFTFYENNSNRTYFGETFRGVNKDVKDTVDIQFQYNTNSLSEKNIITTVEGIIYKELKKYIEKHPIYKRYEKLCLLDILLMQKYNKNEGKYIYHTDSAIDIHESIFNITKTLSITNQNIEIFCKEKIKHRILTFIFYLNDVNEGGETEFFQLYRVRPKKGSLLIFPALSVYTHKGCIPISNDKYILTGWLYSL